MAIEIKSLREATGLSRRAFSDYFGIPYRTVEDWERGARKAPQYLVDLIHYKLAREGFLVDSSEAVR